MKAHVERAGQRVERPVDWLGVIASEMQAVEDCLIKSISSDVPTVFEVSKHLVTAGGKRLRPALVILSALAVEQGAPRERLTSIASTVELIHMASLVHDDVIDGSDSRRGRITANAYWGNKIAVLAGDCMVAKAFGLLAGDGDQRVMSVLAQMTNKMSESEVLQAMSEGDIDMWREHYWQIIRNKTAGFLSSCCRCGAMIAGAAPEAEDALAEYGMQLGLAFQITDDLLDVIGDAATTGKPVGNDIRDGKVTLPVLLALDSLPEPEQITLRAAIKEDNLSDEDTESICRLIRSTSAIEMTRDHARTFTDRAISSLAALPDSIAKANLLQLAERTIDRLA